MKQTKAYIEETIFNLTEGDIVEVDMPGYGVIVFEVKGVDDNRQSKIVGFRVFQVWGTSAHQLLEAGPGAMALFTPASIYVNQKDVCPEDVDWDHVEDVDWNYDIDEVSANASSEWENGRTLH